VPAATAASLARQATLQQRAAELTREARSRCAPQGSNIAKLLHAKQVAALKPILLFLVERGLMTREEADAALETLDLDESPPASPSARIGSRKSATPAGLLFLEENVTRPERKDTR